jgi:hypothetical protein
VTSSVATGLVLVGVLSAMNVLFSLAFARRLKLVEERGMRSSGTRPELLPATGLEIGGFATTTLDGTAISDQDFQTDDGVIALFVSSTCPACDQLKKDLRSHPLDEPAVVFVLGGTSDEVDFDALSGVSTVSSQVIWLGDNSEPGLAFGVQAYPTLIRVARGMVVGSGLSSKELGRSPRRRRAPVAAA